MTELALVDGTVQVRVGLGIVFGAFDFFFRQVCTRIAVRVIATRFFMECFVPASAIGIGICRLVNLDIH